MPDVKPSVSVLVGLGWHNTDSAAAAPPHLPVAQLRHADAVHAIEAHQQAVGVGHQVLKVPAEGATKGQAGVVT